MSDRKSTDLFPETIPDASLDDVVDGVDRQQIREWADMAEMLVSIDMASRGIRNTIVKRDDWDIEAFIDRTVLLNVKATFPRQAKPSCQFSGSGKHIYPGRSATASDLRGLIGKIDGFALVRGAWGSDWRLWQINYFPICELRADRITRTTRSFTKYGGDLSWEHLLRSLARTT